MRFTVTVVLSPDRFGKNLTIAGLLTDTNWHHIIPKNFGKHIHREY